MFKTEKALLLHIHPLGERAFMLSVFTSDKGRYVGVVKAKKTADIASLLDVRWQARLEEQSGTFYVDNATSVVIDYLDDKIRLALIQTVCELLHCLLPERQPMDDLYRDTMSLFDSLDSDRIIVHYVAWEIKLLQSIGFGLDLTSCAGGGNRLDLAYVSPRTGRAVSREKGLPYHDKLLELPRFMWDKKASVTQADILSAFIITTHFFTIHAGMKQLPMARERLIHYVTTRKLSF